MNILSYFSKMKDTRVERNKLHKLEDIVFIAIASVLNEMEMYGSVKKPSLETLYIFNWNSTFYLVVFLITTK